MPLLRDGIYYAGMHQSSHVGVAVTLYKNSEYPCSVIQVQYKNLEGEWCEEKMHP